MQCVEKPYQFQGPKGVLSLDDLLDGRSQFWRVVKCPYSRSYLLAMRVRGCSCAEESVP
jgi:predicted dithiol-disulfide oxidoreductase (DUF899 family)